MSKSTGQRIDHMRDIPSPSLRAASPGGRGKLNPSPSGRGEGVRGCSNRNQKSNKGILPGDLLLNARELRTRSTDAEQLMWYLVRNRNLLGWKFRRQHPFQGYVLDFYCLELKIAVELDGGQHYSERALADDAKRTADLSRSGIEVVRYLNHEVLDQIEAVLGDLIKRLTMRGHPLTPTPLPAGEGFTDIHLP